MSRLKDWIDWILKKIISAIRKSCPLFIIHLSLKSIHPLSPCKIYTPAGAIEGLEGWAIDCRFLHLMSRRADGRKSDPSANEFHFLTCRKCAGENTHPPMHYYIFPLPHLKTNITNLNAMCMFSKFTNMNSLWCVSQQMVNGHLIGWRGAAPYFWKL